MTFTNLGQKIFPDGRTINSKPISPKEKNTEGKPQLDDPSSPYPKKTVIGENLITGEKLTVQNQNNKGRQVCTVHYGSPQALASKLGISYDEFQALSLQERQALIEQFNKQHPYEQIM